MIRAAIFNGPGVPFCIEPQPRPVLQPGEALVRVSMCTVCGSDLHTFTGKRREPTPCVLGHEPVGVVEEVCGELRDVAGGPVRAGDRVVWAVAVSCGGCFFCLRGLPQKCESLRKYGHEALSPQCGPVGGLATHCHLLRGTAVVKVPAELPDEVAAPAGCATATVAAALRAAGQPTPPGPPSLKGRGEKASLRDAGEEGASSLPASASEPNSPHPFREGGPGGGGSCVVLGLGMLGLTACAWADALGLTAIACDISDTRLAQAATFGARHLAKPDSLADVVKAVTAGRGADFALELSGSPDAARASLEALRIGGTAVWVGAVFPTAAVPVPPEQLIRRCLTVTGVHNYAPHDLAAAVAFLAENHERFPFADLVPQAFALQDVEAAFRFAAADRPVRVAVTCE